MTSVRVWNVLAILLTLAALALVFAVTHPSGGQSAECPEGATARTHLCAYR